jgi:D-sedoheptulose 7-phosphate isomerase
MLEQRIQQQFFDSADLQYQSAESPGAPDRRRRCGRGGCHHRRRQGAGVRQGRRSAGQHLARAVHRRFERERPPLAALAPASSSPRRRRHPCAGPAGRRAAATSTTAEGHSAAAWLRAAAQAKDMTVVVLAGRGAAAFGELLAETDVLVAVPHERSARVAEAAPAGAALPVRCSRLSTDGRTGPRMIQQLQDPAAPPPAALAWPRWRRA